MIRASLAVAAALLVCPATSARAQDAPDRVQLRVDGWWPSANIHAAGEANGIQGTQLDLNADFGLTNRAFPEIWAAWRARRRHEFSFEYVPVRYTAAATLGRDVTFAGGFYPTGVLTEAHVSWNAIEFAYAYDFISRPRASLGVMVDVDRTAVQVRLKNAATRRSTSASVATIPAAGLVTRLQVSPRLLVDAHATLLYVPDKPGKNYGGHYFSAETHAAWTLRRHLAADAGFRLLNIRHLGEADSGTFHLNGVLVGLVISR